MSMSPEYKKVIHSQRIASLLGEFSNQIYYGIYIYLKRQLAWNNVDSELQKRYERKAQKYLEFSYRFRMLTNESFMTARLYAYEADFARYFKKRALAKSLLEKAIAGGETDPQPYQVATAYRMYIEMLQIGDHNYDLAFVYTNKAIEYISSHGCAYLLPYFESLVASYWEMRREYMRKVSEAKKKNKP